MRWPTSRFLRGNEGGATTRRCEVITRVNRLIDAVIGTGRAAVAAFGGQPRGAAGRASIAPPSRRLRPARNPADSGSASPRPTACNLVKAFSLEGLQDRHGCGAARNADEAVSLAALPGLFAAALRRGHRSVARNADEALSLAALPGPAAAAYAHRHRSTAHNVDEAASLAALPDRHGRERPATSTRPSALQQFHAGAGARPRREWTCGASRVAAGRRDRALTRRPRVGAARDWQHRDGSHGRRAPLDRRGGRCPSLGPWRPKHPKLETGATAGPR